MTEAHAGGALPEAPRTGLAPSLEGPRLRAYSLQVLLDCLVIVGAFAAGAFLSSGDPAEALDWRLSLAFLPLFLTIAYYNGTYSMATLPDWAKGARRAAVALFQASALLLFFLFSTGGEGRLPAAVLAPGFLLVIAAMALHRWPLALWVQRHWGPLARNTLLIDAGGPAMQIARAFHVDAIRKGLAADLADPDAFDRVGRYLRNMDEVVVSCQARERESWVALLKASGLHGEIVTPDSGALGALQLVERAGNPTSLLVSVGPLGFRSRAMKRVFDLVIGSTMMVITLPVVMVAAVLIWLEDRGPVFFLQTRIGRANRQFTMWKLRTMRQASGDGEGTVSTVREDARVTGIGHFLRRTSIDELPQLFHVLRGEMSLVGPRPHAVGSQAGTKLFWEVDERYWLRHSLRPGLTGLAQVRGLRGATHEESDLSDRLRADLEYLRGWTIWRDVRILFATLGVLVHHRAF